MSTEVGLALAFKRVDTEIIPSDAETWTRFGSQARRLEVAEWSERAFSEREMRRQFTSKGSIVCIARDASQLVGFACAGPAPDDDAATLFNVLVAPAMRHRGLLGKIMATLEAELVHCGYGALLIDARVDSGFADAVQRHYGDRAATIGADHISPWGEQRTIRVTL